LKQMRPARKHADHADEDTLLLMLGGELNAREAKWLGKHLGQCGECAARLQRLQRGVDVFLEYRRAAILPSVGAPPRGWSKFRALLDRAAESECANGPEIP